MATPTLTATRGPLRVSYLKGHRPLRAGAASGEQNMSKPLETQIEALQQSIDVHETATGHDELDITLAGRFPVTLAIHCSFCGQRLGRVSAKDRGTLEEALREADIKEET